MRLFVLITFVAAAIALLADEKGPELPDKNNPDYIYCEDFESGREKTGALPTFAITSRHGVREGAGCKSKFGYSNVLVENNGLPPYPQVHFPRHEGIIYVHYNAKVPSNFYLGRADHGYYLGDKSNRLGRSVVDHSTDHPVWLNTEWDPNSFNNLRGSGYHRMIRSFEGFNPVLRGKWHSYQVMVIPSQKDPQVGRMKVWIDGKLANFCKHDTIPSFSYFWISNYWHSWEYVRKDKVSNVFESYTAPTHPAFEILLDNLIISKKFIEFGPNKARVERVRFTGLKPNSFTMRFDSTVPAAIVSVIWGEDKPGWKKRAKRSEGTVQAPGLFHAVDITGLKPGKRYVFQAIVKDEKGRTLKSEQATCTARAEAWPDFHIAEKKQAIDAEGPWKGEVFAGSEFTGAPLMVRSFDSISYIAWSGHDSDIGLDTQQSLSIRYTRTVRSDADSYAFRFGASDGLRILLDKEKVYEKMGRTQGRVRRGPVVRKVAAGTHALTVEHAFVRKKDWEYKRNRSLAFCISKTSDMKPPVCYAQAIYNTRFYEPDKPKYCGRWSGDMTVTIEYGKTKAYGKTAKAWKSRIPYIKLGQLEVGQTYHWRAIAVDGLGNKTVTPDATFVCGDTLAPQKIIVSPLKRVSDTALELRFKAPGEDGRHGQAKAYDIRWSDKPLTVSNWEKAKQMPAPPKPQSQGKRESIRLEGLAEGKTWYVGIRAIDQVGQAGLLSNIVSHPAGPEVMDCDGDGYGVGSLKGPDPDDYDASIPKQ